RAEELGMQLQFVPGSGPAGRIEHSDLDAYIASGGKGAVHRSGTAQRDGIEEIKVIGLRRKVAEKMQESKRRIPHFAYVEEIDMTELESLRAHLNATRSEGRPKLSVLPFLMRGLVQLLPDYPQINARFDDEAGIVPNAIVERPVVRNGQIVVRKMMNLSSSFDHRVVDGYDAADFIQRLKALLEHPAMLFMD